MSGPARPRFDRRGSGRGRFRVTVAVLAARPETPDWAVSLDALRFDRDVPGHDETFEFDVERWDDPAALTDWLESRRVAPRLVVVSEGLIANDPTEGPGPTRLVDVLRQPFASGEGLCALVAVTDRPLGRVRDVDVAVDAGQGPEGVIAAIVRAATALRLKAPPGRRGGEPAGLRVEAARDQPTVRACFALRHRVYGMLGYLPDDVAAEPCRLEIDGYDVDSIPLAAVVGAEVVGTVRVVLGGVDGGESMHPAWCRALASRCGPSVRHRVETPSTWPLPVMSSPEFRRVWNRLETGRHRPVELSRLIVAPEWRGLGVSSRLIRAVAAEARRLGHRPVVLECIPAQRRLYYAHGFRLLNRRLAAGPRLRPIDLDVPAIALWLPLDPSDPAAPRAARNLLKARDAGSAAELAAPAPPGTASRLDSSPIPVPAASPGFANSPPTGL